MSNSKTRMPALSGARQGQRFVHLVSVDPDQNRFRTYAIVIEQSERSGQWRVIRRWGRLGCDERENLTEHESYEEAATAAEQSLQKRLSRGYSVVTWR